MVNSEIVFQLAPVELFSTEIAVGNSLVMVGGTTSVGYSIFSPMGDVIQMLSEGKRKTRISTH